MTDTEWQPDLLGGPGVPAELTPPLVAPQSEPSEPKPEAMVGSGRRSKTIPRSRAVAIVRQVARDTGVCTTDIMGPSRVLRIAHARQLAYARLRATGASYPTIGIFMDRKHDTVLRGCRALQERESLI